MERVLIVDNEAKTRGALTYRLSRLGLDVTVAETGNEAIERFKEVKPEVVILDINNLKMIKEIFCSL